MKGVLAIALLVAACTAPGGDGIAATTTTNPSSATTTSTEPAPDRLEGEWGAAASMEIARSEHPAVVLNGEMVVMGGLVLIAGGRTGTTETVHAYNPDQDRWRSLPDLPELRHHGMAAVVDGRLFHLGGYGGTGFVGTRSVWELVGDGWVSRSDLPTAVGAGAAVVVDGLIYVVGGTGSPGLHRYDPDDDTWITLTGPAQNREHVAAVAYQGEVWAIGGRWDSGAFATVEIYDTATDTWREGPSMRDARSGFGVAVLGGHIYAVGGEILETLEVVETAERYDPETGEWVYITSPPMALHGNPLVALGDRIFLPGGSMRAAAVNNDPSLYVLSP